MKRIILWSFTILNVVATAYSFLGLLMVASFSGAPNYTPERARFNGNLWGWGTIIFFSFALTCSIILWRIGRRKRLEP